MKQQYKFGSVNLKNNLMSIQGPKHEQGGVSLGKTKEVEGEESIFGDFVFSNRLIYNGGDKKKKGKKKGNHITFADKSKSIARKYKDDNSSLATSSQEREMQKLATEQEEFKQSMMEDPAAVGVSPGDIPGQPQGGQLNVGATPQFAYGGSMGKDKMFLGGAIAASAGASAAGSLLDVGRGVFGKSRKHPDVSLERAEFENADFGRVDFDNVDYSEQRGQLQRDTNSNRLQNNAAIRANSSNAGQLLGNTSASNFGSLDRLNEGSKLSYQGEENMNVGINNQENQINTQIGNAEERFNKSGLNQTNLFNTQISNQERMQNYQIGLQNSANTDAKTDLMFKGLQGLLQTGGEAFDAKHFSELGFPNAGGPTGGDAGKSRRNRRNQRQLKGYNYNGAMDNDGSYFT